jgi:hypothetical protein
MVKGKIEATEGNFGGWQISQNYIYARHHSKKYTALRS